MKIKIDYIVNNPKFVKIQVFLDAKKKSLEEKNTRMLTVVISGLWILDMSFLFV